MGKKTKDRCSKESSEHVCRESRVRKRNGRKRQSHYKVSESEERDKIKESVLEAFRARLKSSPNECGALIVGPSKPVNKATSGVGTRRRGRSRHTEWPTSPASSHASSSSMSDGMRRRRNLNFKRKNSTSRRHKQKTKEVERESTSSLSKHIKIARGVGTTGGAITHTRITQPVGLVNAGKKSLAVNRGSLMVQVPAHIERETQEVLKRVVDTSGAIDHHTVDLDHVQSMVLCKDVSHAKPKSTAPVSVDNGHNISSSTASESSMSPDDGDKFPETLHLRETVVSLMPTLRSIKKQMYPGRDQLKETTGDLLKLLKQNAPRSATPTPIPLLSKTSRSKAVQRSLMSQFEADSLSSQHSTHCGSADSRLSSLSGIIHSQVIRHNSRPSSATIPGPVIRQDNGIPSPMQHSPSDKYDCSLVSAFQPLNAKTVTETSGTRPPTGLSSYKKSAQTHLDNLLALQMKSQLENDSHPVSGKENLLFGNKLVLDDGKSGVYILKKPRQHNNLQLLYESAKLLKPEQQRPDIWADLYKQDSSNELNDLVSGSVINKLHQRLDNRQNLHGMESDYGRKRAISSVDGADMLTTQDQVYGHNVTGSGDNNGSYFEMFVQPADVLPDAQTLLAKNERKAEVQQHEAMEVDQTDTHEAVRLLQKNDIREAEKSLITQPAAGSDIASAGNQFDLIDAGIQSIGTQVQSGYVDTGSQPSDLHSRTSSQCSRCSHQSRSPSKLQCVEADFMPSFHGNYYRSHCATDDLAWEHTYSGHKKDTPMNILDYIDKTTVQNGSLQQLRSTRRASTPDSNCSGEWRAPNHHQRIEIPKPLIDSPSEKHLFYRRHMY